MSAAENPTWGEVCSQVGFSDNLYRTCRKKLGQEFKPAGNSSLEDYDSDDGHEDFDKEIKKSAKPIPKPPPKNWVPEPEGFLEQIMHGDLGGKIALWGGVAILGGLLVKKYWIDAPKETKAA